jgi:hypothetical protein
MTVTLYGQEIPKDARLWEHFSSKYDIMNCIKCVCVCVREREREWGWGGGRLRNAKEKKTHKNLPYLRRLPLHGHVESTVEFQGTAWTE